MVIVDTSVWVDLLKGRETGAVTRLEALLADEKDIFTTGLIIQEVLSGIKTGKEREAVRADLGHFLMIMPTLQTHLEAVNLFDRCRKAGYTIRSLIDCLIAALALEYDLEVLESDRDYQHIANAFPLRIVSVD
jgi:predicted nucleic acid-binding protein